MLLDSNLNIDKSQSTLRREYQPTSLQFLQAHPKWNPRISTYFNHLNPTGTVEVLRTNRKKRQVCFFKSRLPKKIKRKSWKKRVDKLPHDIYIGCSGHSSLLLPGRCQRCFIFIFCPIILLLKELVICQCVCDFNLSIAIDKLTTIRCSFSNPQALGGLRWPRNCPRQLSVYHSILFGHMHILSVHQMKRPPVSTQVQHTAEIGRTQLGSNSQRILSKCHATYYIYIDVMFLLAVLFTIASWKK